MNSQDDLDRLDDPALCLLLKAKDRRAFLTFIVRYGEVVEAAILEKNASWISSQDLSDYIWETLALVQRDLTNTTDMDQVMTNQDLLSQKVEEAAKKVSIFLWDRHQREEW